MHPCICPPYGILFNATVEGRATVAWAGPPRLNRPESQDDKVCSPSLVPNASSM